MSRSSRSHGVAASAHALCSVSHPTWADLGMEAVRHQSEVLVLMQACQRLAAIHK